MIPCFGDALWSGASAISVFKKSQKGERPSAVVTAKGLSCGEILHKKRNAQNAVFCCKEKVLDKKVKHVKLPSEERIKPKGKGGERSYPLYPFKANQRRRNR